MHPCVILVPSTGLAWAVTAVIAVFLTLAVSILTSLIIHSRKIRESENRFRLLFDRVIDALVLLDENGKIIDANRAACVLLGCEKDELMRLTFNDFHPSIAAGTLQSIVKRVINDGKEIIGESYLINKQGRQFPIEGSAARFQFRDQIYIIGGFRDITDRKQADAALSAERQSLREKNIALKDVLDHIKAEKNEIKRHIAEKIDKVIMPTLKKTVVSNAGIDETYLNMLISELKGLASDGEDSASFGSILDVLSPREQEICDLIRSGASTKEIAAALHISIATVNKHRERIRTRLGIANKDVNLSTYLRKPEPPSISPPLS